MLSEWPVGRGGGTPGGIHTIEGLCSFFASQGKAGRKTDVITEELNILGKSRQFQKG